MWIQKDEYESLKKSDKSNFDELVRVRFNRSEREIALQEKVKTLDKEIEKLNRQLEKPNRYHVTGEEIDEVITAFSTEAYQSDGTIVTSFFDLDHKVVFQTTERVTFRLVDGE